MKYIKLFENYRSNGIESVILYHGSKSKFDMFDDSKISTGDGGDLFGKGFYLTNNKDVAQFYALNIAKKDRVKDYKPTGIMKSYIPVFHDDADSYAADNAHINIFKVEGKILNAKTFIIDEEFKEHIQHIHEKFSGWGEASRKISERTFEYLRNNKDSIYNFRGELEYVINQIALGDNQIINGITQYIKDMGYDGIKYESSKDFEGEGSWNYVIYNKEILKSI
jgi:hypothetical protein